MNPILLLCLIAAAPPVAATGDCPSAQAVTAALGSALGSEARVAGADAPRVSDQGDRFSVTALGQSRQYADPARDCDERARAAAVFIALVLNPPVAPAPAAPAAVVQQPSVVAPAPPRAAERWFDLAAAARLDGGSAPETSAAIGFEARVAFGWRAWGVAATAGVLTPTEGRASSVTIRQQRFPLSVGLTARRALSERFVLAGAAGAALVPLTLRAESIDGGSQATRLDAGVRLAAELRYRATPRLAPFLDLHAEFFPRAYALDVDPLGTVASTGRFWLGAAAGLVFETTP